MQLLKVIGSRDGIDNLTSQTVELPDEQNGESPLCGQFLNATEAFTLSRSSRIRHARICNDL